MNLIKEYTFTVVSVCVVIAIIRKITSAHFTTTVINVVCGIVLSLAIISPVIKIKISDLSNYTSAVQMDADALINGGVDHSQDQLRTIITDDLTAYILEKALMYDCSIDRVEVVLSEDALPVVNGICITGRYSPHAKKCLSDSIEVNLGVAKENQEWRYQN